MEGYLVIRHWGGRLEKVWVILDNQQVSCYERFDLNSQGAHILNARYVQEGQSMDCAQGAHILNARYAQEGSEYGQCQGRSHPQHQAYD